MNGLNPTNSQTLFSIGDCLGYLGDKNLSFGLLNKCFFSEATGQTLLLALLSIGNSPSKCLKDYGAAIEYYSMSTTLAQSRFKKSRCFSRRGMSYNCLEMYKWRWSRSETIRLDQPQEVLREKGQD